MFFNTPQQTNTNQLISSMNDKKNHHGADDDDGDDDDEEGRFPRQGSPEKVISGEGKLLIKLKIPKHDDERIVVAKEEVVEEVEEEEDEKVPNKTRVCEFCNKEFNSGKALGGHMRIHSQPNSNTTNTSSKEKVPKKLKSKHPQVEKLKKEVMVEFKSASTTAAAGGQRPVCSICDKSFPSMKSLFGHMRCHPEREWRGIQPPNGIAISSAKNVVHNSTSSSTLSDSVPVPPKSDYRIDFLKAVDANNTNTNKRNVIDLTESLKGWSKTARRGRDAIVSSQTGPLTSTSSEDESEAEAEDDDDDDDDEGDHEQGYDNEEAKMRNVAAELVKLAQGNSPPLGSDSDLTHKHFLQESEATNSNSTTNSAPIEDNANRVVVGSEKRKRKLEESKSTDFARTCFGNPKITDKGKGKAVLKSKVHPTVPILKSEQSDSDKNSDGDEEGSVRSDQSPNGGPIIRMVKSKKQKRLKKLKISELETTTQNGNDSSGDKYKCSTCNKSFLTHQALGGHRSSHNKVKNSNVPIPNNNNSNNNNNVVVEEFSDLANENCVQSTILSAQFDEVVKESSTEHQCKLCNKKFPTGQALGGHKRCHWTPPSDQVASSRVTSPGEVSQTGQKGCQTGRVVVDFDLNEPAPADED